MAKEKVSALERFKQGGGETMKDPMQRLKYFCALAMNTQDWIDSEHFFSALGNAHSELEKGTAQTLPMRFPEAVRMSDEPEESFFRRVVYGNGWNACRDAMLETKNAASEQEKAATERRRAIAEGLHTVFAAMECKDFDADTCAHFADFLLKKMADA